MRALVVLLIAGCGPPSVSVTVERVEAARPEHALLRCRAHGGRGKLAYAWTFGAGLRVASAGAPLDEPTLMVLVGEPARLREGGGAVTCKVADERGQAASASVSLAPLVVARGVIASDGVVTVEGEGFGGARGPDDAVYLAGRHGLERADHACKLATWRDGRIVACAPSGTGAVSEVRVQSGGRLALVTAKRTPGPYVPAAMPPPAKLRAPLATPPHAPLAPPPHAPLATPPRAIASPPLAPRKPAP